MAKRRYSKKGNKIEPSAMTFSFAVPVSNGDSVKYLDLSQIASLVNRRFYRQSLNWAVAGFKFLTDSGITGAVQISKLPNTWVMSNSWEKSFRAWQKMNNEALQEAESTRPKFLDFKVFADADHHALGTAANLLPRSNTVQFTPGEWEYSKFVIPKTNGTDDAITHEIIAVGANYPGTGASGLNAVSMIEGYAASRALPNTIDPNVPTDMDDASGSTPQNFLSALFNDGTDQTTDVLEDLRADNDIAPYPFENDGTATDTQYPNGANQGTGLQIHDLEIISGTTIGGTTRLKGGNFPCGLIRLDFANIVNPEDFDFALQIDLIPGNHRGYLCEKMTEM